jgi:hypothetical protein
MSVYGCNNEITNIFYSGYTIEKIFGCEGKLVFDGGGQPLCDNPIARVSTTGTTWHPICDISGNSAVTRSDVEMSLTSEQINAATNLQIMYGCTKIDAEAFKGMTALTKVNSMGYDVRTIGTAAFSGCTNLSDPVYIGCNVTRIYGDAFKDCPNMTSITLCPETPPALGSGAFDNTHNCPIYVPRAQVDVYKAASGWSAYKSRIEAAS